MADVSAKQLAGHAALKLFNMDSRYRRIARFYPALATIALFLPLALMLGIPLSGWLVAMSAGGGLAVSAAAVAAVSHLASAAGNRLQTRLYPRWPYDSPTNLRFHPANNIASRQQKQRWYDAISRLTGIDIHSVSGDPDETERAINDAIVILRTRVFHGHKLADRLDKYNIDYGFFRNFAGLRAAWILASFFSCVGCWIVFFTKGETLVFPVVASMLFLGCVLAALVVIEHVQNVARHYADSFFGALDACDEELKTKLKKKACGEAAAMEKPQSKPPTEAA